MDIKRLIAGILGIEALIMLIGVGVALWKRYQTGILTPPTEVFFLMAGVLVACILMMIGLQIYRLFTKSKND